MKGEARLVPRAASAQLEGPRPGQPRELPHPQGLTGRAQAREPAPGRVRESARGAGRTADRPDPARLASAKGPQPGVAGLVEARTPGSPERLHGRVRLEHVEQPLGLPPRTGGGTPRCPSPPPNPSRPARRRGPRSRRAPRRTGCRAAPPGRPAAART